MSEARWAGFSAVRLTLAALGLIVGCSALTLLLGVDEAHADDSSASPFAPPAAAAATDPTGEAFREATGDAVANSAMPALEAVAAALKTVTQLPVPVAEPAGEAVAPLVQPPVESVVPLVQAAAERATPVADAVLEPVARPILEPVTTAIPPLLNTLAQPLAPIVSAVTDPLTAIAQIPDSVSEASPNAHEAVAAESQQAVDRLAADPPATRWSAAVPGNADQADEVRPSAPAERSPVTPTAVLLLSAGGIVSGAPSAITDDGQFPVAVHTFTATRSSGGALPAGPSFDPGSTPD